MKTNLDVISTMKDHNIISNSKKINLEAFTLYIYKDYFLINPCEKKTGFKSIIKIEKKTHDIIEIEEEASIPSGYLKKYNFSAFLGILPIFSKTFLLFVEKCSHILTIQNRHLYEIYEVNQVEFISFEKEDILCRNQQGNLDQKSLKINQQNIKINNLVEFLKNNILFEGFYFSFLYDLTLSRSSFSEGCQSKYKFLWNYNIAKNFLKVKDKSCFVGLIQGSIKSFKLMLEGKKVEYILISRRSFRKGGTRFNARGIDSEGNVANFCETQQIVFIDDLCFSHVQIRGSVPVFWQQKPDLSAEVQFFKTKQQSSKAFQKHIKKILKGNRRMMIINLLSQKQGEKDLTNYYETLLKEKELNDVRYQYFDVHNACKNHHFEKCDYLVNKVSGINNYFGFYKQNFCQKKIFSFQQGVLRVNCLDNLDRTNLIQTKMGLYVLTNILAKNGFHLNNIVGEDSLVTAAEGSQNSSIFIMYLKNVWADNGDMISKHYTGTESTHTNVTRTGKRDFKGDLQHYMKSLRRFYNQLVLDSQKQEAINILIKEHTETINIGEIEERLKSIISSEEGDGKNQKEYFDYIKDN